jgi:hypothetical protein
VQVNASRGGGQYEAALKKVFFEELAFGECPAPFAFFDAFAGWLVAAATTRKSAYIEKII